jgi:hypothetical protein
MKPTLRQRGKKEKRSRVKSMCRIVARPVFSLRHLYFSSNWLRGAGKNDNLAAEVRAAGNSASSSSREATRGH